MSSARNALDDARRAVTAIAECQHVPKARDAAYEELRVAFCRLDSALSSGGALPPDWLNALQPYRMPADAGVVQARETLVRILMSAAEADHTIGYADKLNFERQIDALIALVNAVHTARRREELEP